MTVNRTTLLDLPLPVTGTESGTWGDTTNNGLTQYMDIAIAGMSNLTSANFTTGALTIETTEGNSSATNITATSGQYAGFRVTSLAQNSTITVGNTGTNPARSYRLINADATYTLTFKATGQTGITLQPGQTAVVAFNGTDYVIVGMAGAGTVTDNAVVRFDGTTGKLVQNSVVTIADSTGDVAGVGALTMGGNLTLSGGTANGVLYLNGSKVATSGSALTFDGAQLGVNGVTVGRGAGAVSTNTAVGASALNANTTGATNTALGYQSLQANTTASSNTAVGYQAGYSNTTGIQNTYIGYGAGYSNQTGSYSLFVGQNAGQATTGTNNNFVGYGAGYSVTTGSKNTILGSYDGNQDGLDIRTSSNYAVISDGDGNRLLSTANGYSLALDGGAVPQSGTGITFPATQSASSNANTLDDYEEGTWTPRISGTSGGDYTPGNNNVGYYTKVGNVVNVWATVDWTAQVTGYSGLLIISGLPFNATSSANYRSVNAMPGQDVGVYASGSYNALNLGIDPGNSYLFIIQRNDTITSGWNYSHYATVNSTGTLYGVSFTYRV